MAGRKDIEIDELKNIQLTILDDIASFCEQNGLTYFLTFGTLLGAIRHKGYIPWDNDIDIAMPRPDYEKFIVLYNRDTSPYRMLCYEVDKSFPLPFGKVIDNRTVMREVMYNEKAIWGVYVDVFPIDGCPNRFRYKMISSLRMLLNAKNATIGQGRGWMKDSLISFAKFFTFFLSTSDIVRKIIIISKSVSYCDSDLVGCIVESDNPYEKIIISKREVFSSFPVQKFEGREYRIPYGYDEYLRLLYGNYMEFPPIEKRKPTHIFEAWWK